MKLLYRHLKENSEIIEYVKGWNGHKQPYHIQKQLLLTKYIGTLDQALSRFNSMLLRVNEHPLLLGEFENDIQECADIIQKFYTYTKRLDSWPLFMRRFLMWRLHKIGTKKIPLIKKTYSKLITKLND